MCPYKFYHSINLVTQRLRDSVTQKSVRDWSGILCEPCGDGGMGNGNGEWEMGDGSGAEMERRWSEQRYSGKPDGLPERPINLQFTINS